MGKRIEKASTARYAPFVVQLEEYSQQRLSDPYEHFHILEDVKPMKLRYIWKHMWGIFFLHGAKNTNLVYMKQVEKGTNRARMTCTFALPFC